MIILLLVSVLPLTIIPQAQADTTTFGYMENGAAYVGISDVIRGSKFTCLANGTLDSISARIASTGSAPIKFAIYFTNLTLLASTDAGTCSAGTAWYTLNFSGSETVTAGTEYILTAWSSSAASVNLWRDSGDTNQGYYDSDTYDGSFPDPLVPTNDNYEYCVYCTLEEENNFNYYFYGLYDEETGLIEDAGDRAVTVTAYWDDGTAAQSFEVNGTEYKGFSTAPQYFQFELGTADREYWLSADEGDDTSVAIYIFNSTLSSYTLTFYDRVGALSTYSWVTASRYINGSLTVMDKRKVDETVKVVMGLQVYETYVVKVEAEAGTTYTWGDLTTTTDSTIDLTVKGLEFPQEVILNYRYVRAYGYREYYNTTHHSIVAVYEDTKYNTNSVNISIYNSTDDIVHTYLYSDTDNFTYTWSAASYNVSYYMVQTVSHGDYGTLVYKIPFVGAGTMENPFNWDFLGTLPNDVSVSALIPSIILVVLVLIFSPLTSGIGGVITFIVACLFVWWEWVIIDINVLVFTGTITIIWAILQNYKRVIIR